MLSVMNKYVYKKLLLRYINKIVYSPLSIFKSKTTILLKHLLLIYLVILRLLISLNLQRHIKNTQVKFFNVQFRNTDMILK